MPSEEQSTSQPDSIAADLNAAFDSVEKAAPVEVSDTPAPVETPEAKADRVRDEAGRFAKGEAKADEPAPAGEPVKQPVAPSGVEIPSNWPASVKADLEALAKLDPAKAKNWINSTRYWEGVARTEREKAAPFAKLHDALEDVLAPTRPQRQMNGMDDAAYLRALAAADQYLTRDPVAGIKWLAQKYGLTPESLVAGVQEAQANAPSPEIQKLMGEVGQLKNYIGQITNGAQQQALSGVMSQIEAFASEKGADGQPVRPYFDECLNDIQFIVQAQRERGETVNLQTAYEKAVRMNDATWMKVQSQRSQQETAARAAAAEKARRAGFSVTGSSGGASSVEPAESLRAELERNAERLL